jgi:DNA-binding sugar fermentation-stimulating protein
MEGQFILQIVGITEAVITKRPSKRFPANDSIAEVYILSENKEVLAHTPSGGCDGMADTTASVLVAYCPDDHSASTDSAYATASASAMKNNITNTIVENTKHTHTVFLSIQREITKPDGSINSIEDQEQIIGINPKIAYELIESAIEKKLISVLPPVKQFKRNIPMVLEGKINSCFSFVGICDDDVPFIMEVFNVPFAEYCNDKNITGTSAADTSTADTGASAAAIADTITSEAGTSASAAAIADTSASEAGTAESEEDNYNTKIAYYPEKNSDNTLAIQRIKDLTTIKSESIIRCLLAYVIERTDVDCFNFSTHDPEYRAAVKNAIENGVDIVPLMVSWTKEGIAFFVTDKLPVVYPQ